MRQCMDMTNLHRRLRKIRGQVEAIDRMVEEDIPCEDLLSQINAAKAASPTATRKRRSRASPRPSSASPTWAEARHTQKDSPQAVFLWYNIAGAILAGRRSILSP